MKKLIGIIAWISICLMACNTDNEDNHEAANNSICFVANETRAIADISNIQNEGFKVWGGYGTTTVFNGENIVLGSDNIHTTDKPWTNNTYNFFAVYPTTANGTYTVPSTFAINNYNVRDNQEKDLMIAAAYNHAYPDKGVAVGLHFQHALTAVAFNIKLESGKTYKNTYRIVSATIGNVYTNGNIAVGNDATITTTPTGGKGSTNAITEFSGTNFTATKAMVSTPVMTVPQQTTATLHLEIDVNGEIIEIDKDNFVVDWKTGNSYLYNITLDATKDISIAVTTTDWDRPSISDIIIK